MECWRPRVDWPTGLILPVPVDPKRRVGPTPGQARGPLWRRSSPGRYVPSGADATCVEQRIVEQAARLPEGGALTGWAALRVYGGGFFDGLEPDGRTTQPVPLLVPQRHRIRPDPGFLLVRRDTDPGDIRLVHGLPCVRPGVAIRDEVRRVAELRAAVVVLDMALVAALVSPAELDALLASSRWHSGVALLRRARALATTRSRSPAETRMRLIWELDAGLPRPLCNWPVHDEHGTWLGAPDLLSPELGVFGEFDGAGHRTRRQHRVDVDRDDAFRRTGLEGFGVVGSDLRRVPLVVDRMRAAVRRAAEAHRPRRWLLRANPRPLWP